MKFFASILSLIFLLCSPLAYSWNALGHMVVADVAYQNLKPNVKSRVDDLITYFSQEYADMASFEQLAYWPDTLRSQKIETFTHWHYIDVPFTTDGSHLKNIIDTDNAVWALGKVQEVVRYHQANSYERARFLAFLIHIVGDLHQPLHTVSLITRNYPDGDQGGNLYFVNYKNDRIKLHRLWDSGVDVFKSQNFKKHYSNDNAQKIAEELMQKYPQKYFGNRAKDLDPQHWIDEGMNNAKNYVYAVKEEGTVDTNYISNGKRVAQEATVLAGYRLAALLNSLLA